MDNYIKEALKTESINCTVDHPRLLHACMGIASETMEMLLADDDVNFWEEAGDILWYCAVAADEFEVTFDEMILLGKTDEGDLKSFMENASTILDYMKKVVFYGKPLDKIYLCGLIGSIVAHIKLHANADIEDGFSKIQMVNIQKLRVRYGEKFTEDAAENRDLKAERQVL